MKKTSYPGIVALVLLSMASCSKEARFAEPSPSSVVTITATRDDSASRTVVQSNGSSVWWSPEDRIDVFSGPGETPAVFTGQNKEAAATASFQGTLALREGERLYGIYPSSANSKVDANGNVKVQLPSYQQAVAGTFGPDIFPAVAVSDNTTLSFRSVAGGIKFSIEDETVTAVVIRGNRGEVLAGTATVNPEDGTLTDDEIENPQWDIVVSAPEGGFKKGESYYAIMLPVKLAGGLVFALRYGPSSSEQINVEKSLEVKRGVIGKVGELSVRKELDIETVWAVFSTSGAAWNEYFGGAANSDRNIAMDDEYVYVAEAPVETDVTSTKLWAISISDHRDVKLVNTEGVSGGPKALACPRVIKNTDASVNGGKDVLVCSNLTRGGEDPKLYMWINGIDHAPKVVTLTTWATGAWYGDTFTVSGTLQDGILFFDKTGGDANGVVTFNLAGLPGDKLFLLKRIAFNGALGSHDGVCAYYPFPSNDNAGIYSPGRGVESRGYYATFTGDLKSDGNAAYTPTLTKLDYTEGRNGYVLGYNYLEWKGKRYVIYGKQPSRAEGYVYVLEGDASQDWLDIINTAPVKFRRDLVVDGNPRESGSTSMDVTARIINGELYFAAQKQNVACGLYKLVYK